MIERISGALRRNETPRQALDLNDVVRDTLSLTASELAIRAIAVTTQLTPGLPAVLGDRVELQQALLNLILNACDAMSGLPAGERGLTVRTELAPDSGVQASVSDKGPGIAPDYAERIFEPFFTSKEQGLGLGLAICRSIIRAHQGQIWADSNAGAGATFTFRIPAPSSQDALSTLRAIIHP